MLQPLAAVCCRSLGNHRIGCFTKFYQTNLFEMSHQIYKTNYVDGLETTNLLNLIKLSLEDVYLHHIVCIALLDSIHSSHDFTLEL
jgi:hypothetical protein